MVGRMLRVGAGSTSPTTRRRCGSTQAPSTGHPDFRRTINELQRYSVRGKIDSGILTSISEINSKAIIDALKKKNYRDMRTWVIQNLDKDPAQIFRSLYDTLYSNLQPPSVPQVVLIIANYQYKNAFVADAEINTSVLN